MAETGFSNRLLILEVVGFMCVENGEQSLRRAVAEFTHHSYGERNHQGLGNVLIEVEECVGSPDGKVQCRKRLGGLLSYCHRDAA